MDNQRFDELTRTLATGASRRRVLQGLMGGAAAGVFGLLGTGGADAKRDKVKKTKPAKVAICHTTGSATNPYAYISVSERAVKAHEAHGDVIAPDLATDLAHCGGCGQACDAPVDACSTVACVDGACETSAADCEPVGECMVANCDPTLGCQSTAVDDGTLCTTGTCVGGICEPAA